MIKLKMSAANSSSQSQYWDGWRRTRTKPMSRVKSGCRPIWNRTRSFRIVYT